MGARLSGSPADAIEASAGAARQASGANASPAIRLLGHEAEVRRLGTEKELLFHLVNEVRGLVQYGSAIVLRRRQATGRLHVVQLADLPEVDRDAPLVRALEDRIAGLARAGLLEEPLAFMAASPDKSATDAPLLADFASPSMVWLPMRNRAGVLDAGVVFARSEAFTAGEQTLLARLAETYAHAWSALPVQRRFTIGLPFDRRWVKYAAFGLLAVSLLPVRLSVMAPVEVIAAAPFVVTAPIAGVVRSLLVPPNTIVKAGQPLVQFEDIQPRNEMVLAQQRLAVTQARDTKTGAAAFRDTTAAHDMAAAHAELELASVSYDYAKEVLARTLVRTPTAGLAIYTDRRDWEGRAVQVGEEIMQVADPAHVALRVDLSTGNSIELASGAELSVYLDNAPLGGIKGRLRSVSYTPRAQPGGTTSYTVVADPIDGSTPRIGARGTARLYGGHVPLFFQMLRRPIAATRQFIGL
jgi:hypothetical protein